MKHLPHEKKFPLWPDLSPVLCIWRKVFLKDWDERQQSKLSNGTVDWEHNGQYQTVYRCYTWPLSQCQIFAWEIKRIIYSHIMAFLSKIFWGWLHFNNHLLLKMDFFLEDHLHLYSQAPIPSLTSVPNVGFPPQSACPLHRPVDCVLAAVKEKETLSSKRCSI